MSLGPGPRVAPRGRRSCRAGRVSDGGATHMKQLYGHMVRFDAHGRAREIRGTDGRVFSVHRTGFDDTTVPEPGTAVSFLDDEGRWPRARGVRRLPPMGTGDAPP